MTTTLDRNRVHAGVREGGQFATHAKGEADVTLPAPPAGGDPTGSFYVYIERQYSNDLALGPYPTAAAAALARDESMLVTSIVEEDCLECWSDDGTTLAEDFESFEQVLVDLDDVDHLGQEPPSVAFGDVELPVAAPEQRVRIEDPSDVFSPPLYEGPASGASATLKQGQYRALDADDAFTEYAVIVRG